MNRDIKALLRQGDPAEVLSGDKAARVRERLAAALAAGRPEPAPLQALQPRPWAWITAAAGLGALAFGLWHGAPRPEPVPPRAARPGVAAAEPAAPRTQIDFATPGGTRIIWTLIPDQPMERRDR